MIVFDLLAGPFNCLNFSLEKTTTKQQQQQQQNVPNSAAKSVSNKQ